MIHFIYGLTIFVHVIACIGLIAVILLQAGRGGGLSETFAGGAQNLFGTKSNEVLVKATATFAIVFLCTSMLLGILTSKRGRSLLNNDKLLAQLQQAQQTAQQKASSLENESQKTQGVPLKDDIANVQTQSKDVAEK